MLSDSGAPTALEFKLLRLIFLRTLQLDGVPPAPPQPDITPVLSLGDAAEENCHDDGHDDGHVSGTQHACMHACV